MTLQSDIEASRPSCAGSRIGGASRTDGAWTRPAGRRAQRAFAYPVAVALACLLCALRAQSADLAAAGPPTGPDAPEAAVLSEPMRIAMLLAKAAGGGVGYVGATLALDDSATPAEVAIIQVVPLERMKPGEILMLVRDDCSSPTGCLMARRITEKRGQEVATKRYGRPQTDAAKGVDASVIGRVAYVVDLDTGRIRDLRKNDAQAITLVEALRRESRKWHYVGNTVRPRPLRI
jgi:hypothetical protein